MSLSRNNKLRKALGKSRSVTDEITIGSPLPAGECERAGNMAEVMKQVKGIRYLVPGWIPFGMASMVLASPGDGKSAFLLYAVARVILLGGICWFDGFSRGPKKAGFVLWCDTEGSAAITVQRIRDWKLPASRIKVPFGSDLLKPVDLADPDHINQIESVVNKYKIKLVVIDSLRGAHGGDENSSKVVQVLQKLSGIAERTGCAIVIIHHTRKLQLDEQISADSSRGSNAIMAMVRSQIGIDKPDKNSDWCRVQMLKENLGLKPQPIGFRVTSDGLEFGPPPERPRRETKKAEAQDWLAEQMAPGKWYPASALKKSAGEAGFSVNALQRAREELDITDTHKNVRRRKDKKWEWRLPATN